MGNNGAGSSGEQQACAAGGGVAGPPEQLSPSLGLGREADNIAGADPTARRPVFAGECEVLAEDGSW